MSLGPTGTRLLNFILFQAGWFVCVLGAASGRAWLGMGLGLALVVVHLILVARPGREGVLLAWALLGGIVIDSVHVRTGALVFSSGTVHPDFAPPWILVLWLQFASTLRFSLSWLKGRYVLGALLGFGAGALAYAAGARLGAAQLGPQTVRSLLQIGVGWSVALPLLLFVAQRTPSPEEGERYRIF
jgi:hypothetical protein